MSSDVWKTEPPIREAVYRNPGMGFEARIQYVPRFGYSLAHCGQSALLKASLENYSKFRIGNLRLEIGIPSVAKAQEWLVPALEPGERVELTPADVAQFDFVALSEPVASTSASIVVRANNEPLEAEQPGLVEILPCNAWTYFGPQVALAGFVMPDNRTVEEIVARSRYELGYLLGRVASFADIADFVGLKASSYATKAIYYCLQERYGIRYELQPRGYSPHWQPIRFPHMVASELAGTCIDLALLMASCLERVFLDPLLVLIRTDERLWHALVGVWHIRSLLSQPIVEDQSLLVRLAREHLLALVDPVGFSESGLFPTGIPFRLNLRRTYSLLVRSKLIFAIDLASARKQGLTPMPFDTVAQFDKRGSMAIFEARMEARRNQNPALCARHLLIGLLRLEDSVLGQVLAEALGSARELEKFTERIRETIPVRPGTVVAGETRNWRKVIEHARQRYFGGVIGERDLIESLLATDTGATQLLKEAGVDATAVLSRLHERFGSLRSSVFEE